MNRGKLVIVAIVAVALVGAVFSTWYHYRAQHRAQNFWGTSTALLIAEAPHIEALQLDDLDPVPLEDIPAADDMPDDKAGENEEPPTKRAVTFAGMAWHVLAENEADKAPGVSNLRRALLTDTTFDWRQQPALEEPAWRYALVFNNGRDLATVLFDPDSGQVALTDGRKTATLDPSASDDFLGFFRERFPAEATADSATDAEMPDKKPSDEPESRSEAADAAPADQPPASAPEKPAAAEDKPTTPEDKPAASDAKPAAPAEKP